MEIETVATITDENLKSILTEYFSLKGYTVKQDDFWFDGLDKGFNINVQLENIEPSVGRGDMIIG